MSIPKPIQAVIKTVTTNPGGKSWDVSMEPNGDLWLTVHLGDTIADPKPGDILTIQPPYILAHEVKP